MSLRFRAVLLSMLAALACGACSAENPGEPTDEPTGSRALEVGEATCQLGCGGCPEGIAGRQLTGDEAVRRAKGWTDAALQYCGAINGAPDSLCTGAACTTSATCGTGLQCLLGKCDTDKTACSSSAGCTNGQVCIGAQNVCQTWCSRDDKRNDWKCYRSDCSGLVSYSWAASKDWGTWALVDGGNTVGEPDPLKLQPGDALVYRPSAGVGHTVLFGRWTDKAARRAIVLQEHGCQQADMMNVSFVVSGSKVSMPYYKPNTKEILNPEWHDVRYDANSKTYFAAQYSVRRRPLAAPCASVGTGVQAGDYADGGFNDVSRSIWMAFSTPRYEGTAPEHWRSIGCPRQGGLVHRSHGTLGVEMQDFQEDASKSALWFDGSTDGWTAIVYDDGARPVGQSETPGAYLLKAGFWGAYKCIKSSDGKEIGGAIFLGAPTTDELSASESANHKCYDPSSTAEVDVGAGSPDVKSFQCFQRGYMWWGKAAGDTNDKVHVHMPETLDGASPDFNGCNSAEVSGIVVANPPGVRPGNGTLFKTPSTGSTVFLTTFDYKHAFVNESCFFLMNDDFTHVLTIPDSSGLALKAGPTVCTTGSYYRRDSDSTVYRLDSSGLHAMCGAWNGTEFQAYSGYPFGSEVVVNEAHWSKFTTAYPISMGQGIYKPGSHAPQCGDPGYECGVHADPDGGECYDTLDCGPCPVCDDGVCTPGKEDCSSCPQDCGPCSVCGDNVCTAGYEDCSTCIPDCGMCNHLVAGAITAPPTGGVANTGFQINWTKGYSSDNAPASTALYCQTNGGTLQLIAGFGYTPPWNYVDPTPGTSISCKLRTRYDADYNTWVDSGAVTWNVSTSYSAMAPTTIALSTPPSPNGCNPLHITTTVKNNGSQIGTWRARAFLHPAGADESSPQAIEADAVENVNLAPGAQGAYSFQIPLQAPLPLTAGTWEISVVVDDYYNGDYGPTARMTIPAVGSDAANPVVDSLVVYGYAGTPTEVLPGKQHFIAASASDDYGIDHYDIRWRQSGGSWTVIDQAALSGQCRSSLSKGVDWQVPGSLAAGLTLDVDLRVWDLAGKMAEKTYQVKTRSNAQASVTFIKPVGGESYVQADSAGQVQCVPIEFAFTPGVPILQMNVAFSNAGHTTVETNVSGGAIVPVPSGSSVSGCYPVPSTVAGDTITAAVRIVDANAQTTYFYSQPFRVDFASPNAPWRNIVVDPTQTMLPIPPPQFDTATVMWSFGRLGLSGSSLQVYRRDDRGWHDSLASKWYSEFTFARLSYDSTSLGLTGSAPVVPTFTEQNKLTDPSSTLYVRMDPGTGPMTNVYGVTNPVACPNPGSTACNYDVYIRQVANSTVTAPQFLKTYTNRKQFEVPDLRAALLSPTGARLVFLRNWAGSNYYTDLYRETTGTYSFVSTLSRSIYWPWSTSSRIVGFTLVTAGSLQDLQSFEVAETTGSVSNAQTVFSDVQNIATAKDTTNDDIYAVATSANPSRVRIARLSGTTWTTILQQDLPSTWRGQTISGLVVPYPGVYVAAGNIALFLQGTTPQGSQTLLIRIPAGGGFDLEDAFPDPLWYAAQTSFTLSPQGQLYRAWPCKWNLDDRLCLQTSQAATVDCYDANPCTLDSWNPVSGLCANTLVTCASDGDACNGPEVCNPVTGACETDTAQAVHCDNGQYCDGSETCNPITGACVTSNVPQVDDGKYCTVDSCDEAQHQVKHTPDNDRCPSDLCATSVCNPSGPGADPTTGCVNTPVETSDDIDCTADSCDSSTGEINHVVQPGFCVIDGACVASGVKSPSNACQACEPSTSLYSWSSVNEGGLCDDGQGCTTGDRCVAGLCIGTLKDCSASVVDPQCQASTCAEPSGTCAVVNLQNNTACDDGNACTQTDTCQSGSCTGTSPVVCTALDDCHLAGQCNSANGLCSAPVKPDGSPCAGGGCWSGVCVPGPEPDGGLDAPDDVDDSSIDVETDATGGSGGAAGGGGAAGAGGMDNDASIPDAPSDAGGGGSEDAWPDQGGAAGEPGAGGSGGAGGTGQTGGAGGSTSSGGSGSVCAPGESVECVGPGACRGGQVCLPDGSGYGPCDCGDASAPAPAAPSPASSGCGCSLPRQADSSWLTPLLALGLVVAGTRRRERMR